MLKRIGAVVIVFLSGVVACAQVTSLLYGVPEHYQGHWAKLVVALILALIFGVSALAD